MQGADGQPASVPAPPMATWPQQPVNNDPQDLLTATANNTAPRMKKKGGLKRHIKSTANVAAVPHHTKLGSFAGMTIEQIFTPRNGIDIDTFFGSKALYIAAHIDSPKRVEAMINEKHQIENDTNEDLVKEKVFNYRFVNALKHKFGPNNLDESRAALERAQEDDQARQDYIAMLLADDSCEFNPPSICTFAGCRRYHASQSSSSASAPAVAPYAISNVADASLAPVISDETSSEAQMGATYAPAGDTVGDTSSRLRKRTHDTESTDSETQPPMKTGTKRRKMNGGGGKVDEQHAEASLSQSPDPAHSAIDSNYDPCLDPALRKQAHSGSSEQENQSTSVAAPTASTDESADVSNVSSAAAVAQHHSSPPSDTQPNSAINAANDQASTMTEDAQTSEQVPEDFSGLSSHGSALTSVAPYYHNNSGALDLFGHDVEITRSSGQLEDLHRDENDAFLREEFVNKDFGTATDQPFDSDANWGVHAEDDMPELYPELSLSDHLSQGESGDNALAHIPED